MMTESERRELLVSRRRIAEQNVKEAELLLDLVKIHLKRADRELAELYRPCPENELAEIMDLYESGLTAGQIGKRLNRDDSVVYKILVDCGLIQVVRPKDSV